MVTVMPDLLRHGPEPGLISRSLELSGLDGGLGAEADRDRERHLMAAGRDVVVVDREGEVVDVALLQGLVVGIGQVQLAGPYDGPHAVFPDALDLVVVCS